MTGCLGCNRCEDGPMVTLVNGEKVCSECPEWKDECDAMYLLKMPLSERRKSLDEREKKRGKASVDSLKIIMGKLHNL